ncbi:hypothetical protein D3C73_05730 [compost metagenome]
MGNPQKKVRSKKEQLQLDRMATFHALRRAIARDPTRTLSPATFFVVWTLLSYMGEEGEAFPSMRTLAADIGMHERTVRDHLERAVAAGFLRMQRDGRRKTNVYTLPHDVPIDPSVRVIGTGHSDHMTGSTAPVTRSTNQGVVDSHPDGVNGPSRPGDRAIVTLVTGAVDPTIHVEEIHKEDPRKTTLVRSPFGRLDQEAREDVIQRLTLDVYNQTHGLGRERSRKVRIARAFRELAGRGVNLRVAASGTIAAMHGPDAHNVDLNGHAAAEKILLESRWESWTIPETI